MLSFRPAERQTILVVVDAIIVELTTLLAFWIMAARAGWPFDRAYLIDQIGWFVFLPALWFLSAMLCGFYDAHQPMDVASVATSLLRTVTLVVVVYLLIYFFFATPGSLPRGVVGYQGVASFVLIALWRMVYLALVRRLTFARKVIIVGAGWAARILAQAIVQNASTHYRILGFVDDDPTKQGMEVLPPRNPRVPNPYVVFGTSHDLLRRVQEQGVSEVVLAITHDVSSSVFQALMRCKEQGVQITLMPVLYEQLTGCVPIEHIGDNWNVALPLDSAEAGGLYAASKRVFDIVGALIGLAFFLPMLPLIALAIRLDSPGPIFYSQQRVGKGGQTFNLLKLRTMVADAEPDGHAMRAEKGDSRITKVGQVLRKTHLDEMPQLFNVLRGEMSAVGPRPERPEHLAELDQAIPFHRLRNAVKPGMAGWAVINYEYIDSLEDARIRLQYDLYYIKHQSIGLDFVILLRTMGHALLLRGR